MKMMRIQRLTNIRIAYANRTNFGKAAGVLPGTPPIELIVMQEWEVKFDGTF